MPKGLLLSLYKELESIKTSDFEKLGLALSGLAPIVENQISPVTETDHIY